MAHLTAVDSDGDTQIVWLQELDDSCGPACVFMIESMKRRRSVVGGEERVRFLTSLYADGYRGNGEGTHCFCALAAVLNGIGIKAQASANSMTPRPPYIGRIEWSEGGGHFVVCAKIAKNGNLVCLDPWYGLTEQSVSKLPDYLVRSSTRDLQSFRLPKGARFSDHIVSIQ